jgi:hypothetical protein
MVYLPLEHSKQGRYTARGWILKTKWCICPWSIQNRAGTLSMHKGHCWGCEHGRKGIMTIINVPWRCLWRCGICFAKSSTCDSSKLQVSFLLARSLATGWLAGWLARPKITLHHHCGGWCNQQVKAYYVYPKLSQYTVTRMLTQCILLILAICIVGSRRSASS